MANISFYRSFGLCYFLLLGLIFADDHGVTFLYPTTGLTLNYLDTINVSYLSPFPEPMLYTFCDNSTNNGLIQETQQNVQPFNGFQLVELVWQGVSSCYFDLRPNSSAGYGANSPVVIVLPSARAESTTVGLSTAVSTSATTATDTGTTTSTSSGASTGTGTGTSTGTSTIASTATSTGTNTDTSTSTSSGTSIGTSASGSSSTTAKETGTGLPSTSNTGTAVPVPSSNSGLSIGAKAGIGVGFGVLVVALLAGIAFFLLQRRKAKNVPTNPTTPGNHAEYYGYGQKYEPVGSEPGSYVRMHEIGGAKLKPCELGSELAHELPGGEVAHEMNPETVAKNTRANDVRRFSWDRTPIS